MVAVSLRLLWRRRFERTKSACLADPAGDQRGGSAGGEAIGLAPRELYREVSRKHIFTHIVCNMKGIYLEVSECAGSFRWFTEEEINTQAALPTAFRLFWEEK